MFKKVLYTILIDFLPVVLFITVYDRRGFAAGTVVIILSTIVSVAVSYIKDKRLPVLAIFIALLTTLFGVLTLHSHDPRYIQMRDTFYDGILSIVLFMSLLMNGDIMRIENSFNKLNHDIQKDFNNSILKKLFGHVFIKLNHHDWIVITWNWIIHFAILAITNEIVRRHFPHYWLDYKAYVILFTITHGAILMWAYRKKF